MMERDQIELSVDFFLTQVNQALKASSGLKVAMMSTQEFVLQFLCYPGNISFEDHERFRISTSRRSMMEDKTIPWTCKT